MQATCSCTGHPSAIRHPHIYTDAAQRTARRAWQQIAGTSTIFIYPTKSGSMWKVEVLDSDCIASNVNNLRIDSVDLLIL